MPKSECCLLELLTVLCALFQITMTKQVLILLIPKSNYHLSLTTKRFLHEYYENNKITIVILTC